MRYNFTLLFTLLMVATAAVQGQGERFIDPLYEVSEPTLDTFGTNIDVLELSRAQAMDPGARVPRSLEMDVYQPVGDDDLSLRPVVVFFPTGNFLPQYVNQGLYGTRQDSIVIELVDRLTARGFVSIAADYRLGWNPRGTEEIRTSTILQAAYRGGQDAHMMARYLRKTVAEEANPYRIDTSRIVFWGLGTGGYVTQTHAYLDDIQEVLDDERFYDANDNPYVFLEQFSDPQGLTPTTAAGPAPGVPWHIVNHSGYESTVAMTVNGNGALGDIDWIDGTDDEPIAIGFHNPNDIFAPFSFGDVVVPTTEDIVIGCVAGTEQAIETSNELGNQDAIASANGTLDARFGPLAQAVNDKNAIYKTQTITPLAADLPVCQFQTVETSYEVSHDNMYPFVGQGLGTPYNWVDPQVARDSLEAFVARGGLITNPNGIDGVLGGENATNPNAFNPAGAKAVIDTMVAFFVPRAYVGLDLETLVSTENLISNASVALEIFPNPIANEFTVSVAETEKIRTIRVLDMEGRVVRTLGGLNTNRLSLDRQGLTSGVYVVQLVLDRGMTARKVVLK